MISLSANYKSYAIQFGKDVSGLINLKTVAHAVALEPNQCALLREVGGSDRLCVSSLLKRSSKRALFPDHKSYVHAGRFTSFLACAAQ